ncbi:MAG: ABC transporter ATP-binding protein [Desulfurococcaceae archaeon]
MELANLSRSGNLLIVRNLKVLFPVRRTFIELVSRRPRRFVRAVDDVTFSVSEGEIFALAGESGCGKTTLGKTIVGLYQSQGGDILYKPSKQIIKLLENYNIDITNEFINLSRNSHNVLRIVRREIQMIWQDPYGSLNPRRKILDSLIEPLDIHQIGSSFSERYDLICKILEAVKLTPPEDFINRYPHMLSGGQRQRVVIARALITQPRLVIADEPVSMLDVSIRAEILQLLMNLKEKFNLTYIFITHDLALARYISNRLAIMYLGKIVELGATQDVLHKPLHPYTRALIEAVPEPNPKRRFELRQIPIKGEIPSPLSVPTGCRFYPRCVLPDEQPWLNDLCKNREPPIIEYTPGHFVACWLYAK